LLSEPTLQSYVKVRRNERSGTRVTAVTKYFSSYSLH
jgi:hypothetical protein